MLFGYIPWTRGCLRLCTVSYARFLITSPFTPLLSLVSLASLTSLCPFTPLLVVCDTCTHPGDRSGAAFHGEHTVEREGEGERCQEAQAHRLRAWGCMGVWLYMVSTSLTSLLPLSFSILCSHIPSSGKSCAAMPYRNAQRVLSSPSGAVLRAGTATVARTEFMPKQAFV